MPGGNFHCEVQKRTTKVGDTLTRSVLCVSATSLSNALEGALCVSGFVFCAKGRKGWVGSKLTLRRESKNGSSRKRGWRARRRRRGKKLGGETEGQSPLQDDKMVPHCYERAGEWLFGGCGKGEEGECFARCVGAPSGFRRPRVQIEMSITGQKTIAAKDKTKVEASRDGPAPCSSLIMGALFISFLQHSFCVCFFPIDGHR